MIEVDRLDPVAPGVAPRVAMALFGNLTFDSRVRREARALAEAGYDVTIVCLADAGRPSDLPAAVSVRVQPAPPSAVIPGSANPFFKARSSRLGALRARGRWLSGYVRGLRAWGRLAVRAAGPTDAWHAHDLAGLAAIAPSLPAGVPLVYDSHELFLETGTALQLPGPLRLLLRAYERRLVARTAAVVTVNEALAAVLRRRYRPRRIVTVHNCPDRWDPPVEQPSLLRVAAGIPASSPLILYHGALSASRGIEQLMEALHQPGLGDAHLVLMGTGELRDAYRTAAADSRWNGRLHVLDPVLPAELLGWVASADVGAMPLQPSTLNLRLSTPNKLFECLAAGTPVVASDFPALRRIIVDDPDGPLGAVCDPTRVDLVAVAIRSILELPPADRSALRKRCSRAARIRWNWAREAETLVALYGRLELPMRDGSPAPDVV